MASAMFVWFIPLDGIGEESIDLYKCKRFAVSEYDERRATDGLCYYFARDERSDGGRWIRCVTLDDYGEDYKGYPSDIYRECRPEEVAHKTLFHRIYGDRLPKELEEYRSMGDLAKYGEWRMNHRGATGLTPEKPKPEWNEEGNCLKFKGEVCLQFRKKSTNQHILIMAFHELGWKPLASNPFGRLSELKHTIKTMNAKEDLPIAFWMLNKGVAWKPKV